MKNAFLSFEEARDIIRSKSFVDKSEFEKFIKGKSRVIKIPSHPSRTYKNEWLSWGDWLGTDIGQKAKKHDYSSPSTFPTFEEARIIARSLKLTSHGEWIRNHSYRCGLPAYPPTYYKDKWTNWTDFLGLEPVYDRLRRSKKVWKSYEDVKSLAKSLNIKSALDWINCKKSGLLLDDVPYSPNKIYKNEWKGWTDFLDLPIEGRYSSGEIVIRELLINNSFNFLEQYRSNWLGKLSLDFYLPDLNIAIEVQGDQHFKPIDHFGGEDRFKIYIENDKIKFNLCLENNIKLLYYVHNSNVIIPKEFTDKYEYIRELPSLLKQLGK